MVDENREFLNIDFYLGRVEGIVRKEIYEVDFRGNG